MGGRNVRVEGRSRGHKRGMEGVKDFWVYCPNRGLEGDEINIEREREKEKVTNSGREGR